MLARTFPCEITTPLGSAVVPEVKTICKMSSRPTAANDSLRGAPPSRVPLRESGDFDFLKDDTGTPPATPKSPACFAEQTQSFASTCPATRPANSPEAPSSIGTTTTPRKTHPKNTATHSARVLAPKHHPLALANPPRLQITGEPTRHLQNIPISEPLHPVSTPLPVSAPLAMRPKVRQKKLC